MEPLQFDKYFETRVLSQNFAPRFFIRTRLMKKYLEKLNGNLLDAGCGEGNFLYFLSKSFGGQFNYFGFDISEKAITYAKSLNMKADLSAGLITDVIAKEFDVITCGEVLEHIKDDGFFLKQVNRLAKKEGHLVLSVPFGKKLWSFYDEDAGHFRRYEKKELFAKLNQAGFKIVDYKVWGFPLIRLLYFFLAKKNKEYTDKKTVPKIVSSTMLFVKYVFLVDNFFNFLERGIGIVVLAQKEREHIG